MQSEGRVQIDSRRHGPPFLDGAWAWLRRKQWWSFEGLDTFFLAMRLSHILQKQRWVLQMETTW